MTLTEFLLARIAEDEGRAKAATPGAWEFESAPNGFSPMVTAGGMVVADTFDKPHLSDAAHIARHDPTRVLAECEAKRVIVETHRHADYSFGNSQSECPSVARPLAESMILRNFKACDTLLLLAAVYADHPDYREEWKP